MKSYRVYQELESRMREVTAENDRLRSAVQQKDELIRRLAAEIAVQSRPDELRRTAAETYVENVVPIVPSKSGFMTSSQGPKPDDGTSEEDAPLVPPIDGLSNVPSVKLKKPSK